MRSFSTPPKGHETTNALWFGSLALVSAPRLTQRHSESSLSYGIMWTTVGRLFCVSASANVTVALLEHQVVLQGEGSTLLSGLARVHLELDAPGDVARVAV
jgi:hypothetical protein